jgi:hypothetical protein
LGKFVETHFVPALAVVRSEIGRRKTVTLKLCDFRTGQGRICGKTGEVKMNRLTLNRRSVVTLRQRRPFPPFMGCRAQTRQPANRQWAFDLIGKPNSGRAKVVMKSLQPAKRICGKNKVCILFMG